MTDHIEQIITRALLEGCDNHKTRAQIARETARQVMEAALAGGVSLSALRAANTARQREWCPDQVPDLSFRGNELAGEVGEACNVIKKIERERLGWAGSRATKDQLAEELADVLICADLAAMAAGVDLEAALVRKFNATSEKLGLATRLEASPSYEDGVKEGLRRAAALVREKHIVHGAGAIEALSLLPKEA